MGYILILLIFLIWRNTVSIRKAVYLTAYGNEYKKGIIKRMFVALADIRKEEKEEKKQKKAKKETRENVNKESSDKKDV